ncbi:MAG TPA: nuclear transport factor 2 family protein [Burkholderiales bacterium]|nr:nuclear transport factor 2 family protein [Burkholderiales bacterium]
MPPSLSVSELATRLAVEDAVVRMFVATDERDWPVLEDCFTNPFTLDMTSMVGGAPTEMTPSQVAQAWATGFKPLDHVHHQIGNVRTEVGGDQALLRCYGVAFHHRAQSAGVKSRVFVGTYELQLQAFPDRWRIRRLVFKLKFIDGNLELEKSA